MRKKFIDAPVRNVLDRITRFRTVGDVVLNADEEQVMLRWEYCDMLLRQRHTYLEIVEMLKEKFGISRYTADKDYGHTQAVFAKCRAINKKYDGALHLDRINKMIDWYEKKIMELDEDGKPARGSKEMAALGAIITKLYDNYTYQLNSIPTEDERGKTIVPSLIFKFTQNNFNAPMSPEDALKAAGEYIDYEHTTGSDDDGAGDAASTHEDQAG